MPEGYCVKCKARREIAEGLEERMKNGRRAFKGKCPVCGTVMFKILSGKITPASPSTEVAGSPPSDSTDPSPTDATPEN